MPSKPTSETRNDLDDFAVMLTTAPRPVAIKQEPSAIPDHLSTANDGLHIHRSEVLHGPRLDTHVPPDMLLSVNRNGVDELLDEPGIDLVSFIQPHMQFDRAEKALCALAKQCPGAEGAGPVPVTYGMVNLGKASSAHGHQLVYFARPDGVWFIDCQKISGGSGKAVATKLNDLFEFSDEQSIKRAFQTRVFITPAYPPESAALLKDQLRAASENAPAASTHHMTPDAASAVAHRNRGEALIAQKNYVAALEAFTQAVKLDSRDGRAHACRGFALHRMGRNEEALAAIKTALECDPECHQSHVLYATLALKAMGDAKTALSSFNRAVELEPSYFNAQRGKAEALEALGHPVEALEAWNSAIALHPENSRAHAGRARALCRVNDPEAALAAAIKAVELGKNEPHAYQALGGALNVSKRHNEALDAFDQALALEPKSPGLHVNRARVLNILRRFTEALTHASIAVEDNKNRFFGLYQRADALLGLKRYPEALDALDEALKIKSDPYAYNLKGACLQKLHKLQPALDAFSKAIELSATFYSGHINQAKMLHLLGRNGEALVAVEKAILLVPKDSMGHDVKNRICSEMAKALLAKAADLQRQAWQAAEQSRQCSNPPAGQAVAPAANLPAG